MNYRNILTALIIILIASGIAYGTTTTWRRSGFTLWGYDIDANGLNVTNASYISGDHIGGVIYADQYATIQDALDASNRTNSYEVYIPSGTYTLTSCLNVPENITVRGAGQTTHIKAKAAGISLICLENGTAVAENRIYNTISNIRLTDIDNYGSITGISLGTYTQETMISQNWFGDNLNKGIDTTTNKKIHIIDNFFGGTGQNIGTGIKLSTTGDIIIIGNDFHEFDYGISGTTEKTQIIGNDFYAGTALTSVGINLGTVASSMQNAEIIGNTFNDMGYGIKLLSATSNGTIINGNYFWDISKNSMFLRGYSHIITNNYFYNVSNNATGNDAAAIYIDEEGDHIISGNTGYNYHSLMNYFVIFGSGWAKNSTVTLNNIKTFNNGLVSATASDNNKIFNNFGSSPFDHGLNVIAPPAFGAGDTYFNTTSNLPCWRNATSWNRYNDSVGGC